MFAPPRRPVEFSAQPQSERLSKGIDKNGKIKYETRRWVDLTNRGTEDALGEDRAGGGIQLLVSVRRFDDDPCWTDKEIRTRCRWRQMIRS